MLCCHDLIAPTYSIVICRAYLQKRSFYIFMMVLQLCTDVGLFVRLIVHMYAEHILKIDNRFTIVLQLHNWNFSCLLMYAHHTNVFARTLWWKTSILLGQVLQMLGKCPMSDCNYRRCNLLHSYLFWASCELRVVSYGLKTVSKMLRIPVLMLLGFSRNICVGVAHIVGPHLGCWTRVLQAVMS